MNPGAFDPNLLAYVLRSRLGQWQMKRQLAGATNQIEIYPDQLAALRLPILEQPRQAELIRQITTIESDISAARARLRQPTEVINEILYDENKACHSDRL